MEEFFVYVMQVAQWLTWSDSWSRNVHIVEIKLLHTSEPVGGGGDGNPVA